MGDQARTLQKGTKISREEMRWLEGLHGSVHAGLRVALDRYKVQVLSASDDAATDAYLEALDARAVQLTEPAPVKVKRVPAEPRPVVPVDDDGTPIRCRIHRAWDIIDEFYDKGVAMREKRCTACGFIVVERAS